MRPPFAHLASALVPVLAASACAQILGTSPVELWSPDSGEAEDANPDGTNVAVPDSSTDATTSPDASGADGGEIDANDAMIGDAAVADAAPDATMCGSLTLCGSQCVDIRTSGGNCGGCNHSCGNGDASCVAAMCEPVPVFEARPIVGFAVDDGKVFVQVQVDGGLTEVDECPSSGCPSPSVVIAPSASFSGIAAGGGIIELQSANSPYAIGWFSEATGEQVASTGTTSGVQGLWFSYGGDFIYEAEAYASAMTLTVSSGGSIVSQQTVGSAATGSTVAAQNPYATDGTDWVFSFQSSDAGTGLAYCAVGSSDCNAPSIVTTNVPYLVNVHSGVVYLINQGTVTTCPVTGCPPSPSQFATLPFGTIESTAIDNTGLYWLDSNGAISMCPLAGCADGGIVPVIGWQVPAATFALDDGFVYYAGAGAYSTNVYKVAEPIP